MPDTANNFFQSHEALIKKVANVVSAKVVSDGESIEEIHVLADSGRSAKQIVRDIETLLKVEFGVDVNHKKISVVQLNYDDRINTIPRLEYKSMGFYRNGNKLEIKVEISAPPENLVQGEAAGIYSRTGCLRMVAEATLNAVENALPEHDSLSAFVEEVRLYSLESRKVTLVLLTLIAGKRDEQFVGASLVHDDEKEAVVRATLDALNRHVEQFLKKVE